jgi:hypothetical protein
MIVMPGLVPGIHALVAAKKNVDGRDRPGHDVTSVIYSALLTSLMRGSARSIKLR